MRSNSYRCVIFLCLFLVALSLSSSAMAQNNQAGTLWSQVPVKEKVPILRAVFYPEGYQLIGKDGRSILVPFDYGVRNLFVMKFAVSPDGTMYFVNNGRFPVLFIPQDGYLTNGVMIDTRWYPFPSQFHPARPVFLGIMPGFNGFLSFPWYSGLYYYGGYWSKTAWTGGEGFPATPGQVAIINGTQYVWQDFVNYGKLHATNQTFNGYWTANPTAHPVIGQNPILGNAPVNNGSEGKGRGPVIYDQGGNPPGTYDQGGGNEPVIEDPLRYNPLPQRPTNGRPVSQRPRRRHGEPIFAQEPIRVQQPPRHIMHPIMRRR